LIEVHWDDSGSGTLQKLNMRCLYELFRWEWIDNIVRILSLILSLHKYFILNPKEFLIPFAMTLYRLREYAYNRVLNLLSNVVTGSDHGRVVHGVMHALRIVIMLVTI